MAAYVSTRHWMDTGTPKAGYVYLVRRNSVNGIKIGSTIWYPKGRIGATDGCDHDGFLMACYTEFPREVESYLHETFAGKKTGGVRDTFALSAEDVLTIGLWFDGGVFACDDQSSPLSLVDLRGDDIKRERERAKLILNAVRIADKLEASRRIDETGEIDWVRSVAPVASRRDDARQAGQYVRLTLTVRPDQLDRIRKELPDKWAAELEEMTGWPASVSVLEIGRWLLDKGLEAFDAGDRPPVPPIKPRAGE